MRLFLFLLIMVFSCYVSGQKPVSAKEPSWIAPNAIDYTRPAAAGDTADLLRSKLLGDTKDGYFDLVHERQVNLNTKTTYRRVVIRIVTEAGIQNGSKVSVSFDPTYEHLSFHKIDRKSVV